MSDIQTFTFGDVMPVMDHAEILDYVQTWAAGKWFEPPVSWVGLAKTFRASVHHASAIYFKRNVLASTFIPHKRLSQEEFGKLALDYLVFGNCYLENRRNRLGDQIPLARAAAKQVRRATDFQRFFRVNGWDIEQEFEVGSIVHMLEPDINQEVYGLPEYLAGLNSAWLNESATLFRRKYYENGSHAGFILYMTDPAQNQTDIDAMREALMRSKGPGNFRNMFVYAPNGKKDGIQLIPMSEVVAKDEFFNIKNVSRDDLLAAHRIPPQLMGIVPSNTGGFGAADKAAEVFGVNEIGSLQRRFEQINDAVGDEVVRFKPYSTNA